MQLRFVMFDGLTNFRNRYAVNRYREALWASRVMVAVIILGAGFGVFRVFFIGFAQTADAQVVGFESKRNEEKPKRFARVYEFTDLNGNSFTFESDFANELQTKQLGDSVQILYLPSNPKWAIENTFPAKWTVSLLFVGLEGMFYCYFRYRLGMIPLAGRSPIEK